MKKIFLIFFLISCTPNKSLNYESLNFNRELTFNEFETLLKKYNKLKGFPNISN